MNQYMAGQDGMTAKELIPVMSLPTRATNLLQGKVLKLTNVEI